MSSRAHSFYRLESRLPGPGAAARLPDSLLEPGARQPLQLCIPPPLLSAVCRLLNVHAHGTHPGIGGVEGTQECTPMCLTGTGTNFSCFQAGASMHAPALVCAHNHLQTCVYMGPDTLVCPNPSVLPSHQTAHVSTEGTWSQPHLQVSVCNALCTVCPAHHRYSLLSAQQQEPTGRVCSTDGRKDPSIPMPSPPPPPDRQLQLLPTAMSAFGLASPPQGSPDP